MHSPPHHQPISLLVRGYFVKKRRNRYSPPRHSLHMARLVQISCALLAEGGGKRLEPMRRQQKSVDLSKIIPSTSHTYNLL
jgi:hypothetical protein